MCVHRIVDCIFLLNHSLFIALDVLFCFVLFCFVLSLLDRVQLLWSKIEWLSDYGWL